MTERRSARMLGALALLLAVTAGTSGCRSGSGATSYQVRWARPGDKSSASTKEAKAGPKVEIAQASAEANSAKDLKDVKDAKEPAKVEAAADDPPEKHSGWRNLLGLDHQRVRLPRTDLSEDDDTVVAGPPPSEF